MAALWFFAPKRPLVFLLQASSADPPVHAPYAWLFVLGLLQAQWTYTGFDGSAHIAEETVDPRRRAPWGMVMAMKRLRVMPVSAMASSNGNEIMAPAAPRIT